MDNKKMKNYKRINLFSMLTEFNVVTHLQMSDSLFNKAFCLQVKSPGSKYYNRSDNR